MPGLDPGIQSRTFRASGPWIAGILEIEGGPGNDK
jgi:hypothetical protein